MLSAGSRFDLPGMHLVDPNLDRIAGLRITSFAGFAMTDGESSESYQCNFVTFLQALRNRIDDGIIGFTSLSFADAGIIDQIAEWCGSVTSSAGT